MKITGFAFFAFPFFILFVLISCHNNQQGKATTFTNDTLHFFPVNEYIRSQIARVDSGAVFIYKIAIRNGRKDSSVLNKKQFDQLAQTFLEYDISDKSIHKYYKENVFMDKTTNSYTFDYTATESSLPLRSLDILVGADDQRVKRIFLNKVKTNGQNTITEKAGWKNDERFYINRIIENAAGETAEQNTIVWQNQQ